MKTLAQKPSGTGGGSVATRGLLVQTLVAILDVVQANQNFTEITLEPAFGDQQFDFVWKDAAGTHATQVKSTINTFSKADVENWAKKLEKARTTESCRLVLVGNIPACLDRLHSVGAVVIEKKNLHLGDLYEQAAHRVAKFLEAEGLPAGTALQREMVVHALVSHLEQLATNPDPLSRKAFIGLLRQWIGAVPKGGVPILLSHFDVVKYAPAKLFGRETETKLLNDVWVQAIRGEKGRPHILTFVALGGEGKTSLVAKWVADMAAQDWPGCDAAFAWSFYSQGTREQLAADSDLFLKAALDFFGDNADREFAAGSAGAFEKGQRLARLVGGRRSLLILDGLEPLQYAPTAPTPGELKDQGIAALLRGLATASQGLCIVTTRYSLPDLKAFKDKTVVEKELKRLSTEAGIHLLQQLGVRKESGSKAEFEKLVEDVKGHALTLTLLGGFLKRAFHGDIRQRDHVKFEKADEKIDGGHAFRTLDAYEKWLMRDGGDEGRREVTVLRLMGLFDRPADAGCLAALRRETIPGLTEPLAGLADEDWEYCLTGLENAKLLTVNRDASGALASLDAHPHIREYFAKQVKWGSAGVRSSGFCRSGAGEPPEGGTPSEAWRAAHRRLYEHLCATTPDKPWPTLQDLQPLYQAVAHGCQAGLQQEACDDVYFARILRRNEKYAVYKLGAFGSDLGAVTSFFEQAWSRVSPAVTEADKLGCSTKPPIACAPWGG